MEKQKHYLIVSIGGYEMRWELDETAKEDLYVTIPADELLARARPKKVKPNVRPDAKGKNWHLTYWN